MIQSPVGAPVLAPLQQHTEELLGDRQAEDLDMPQNLFLCHAICYHSYNSGYRNA